MKTRNKKNKSASTVKIIVLLIALAIISSGLTRVAYFSYQDYRTKYSAEFPAQLVVAGAVGLSADTSKFDFGISPPKGIATREVILHHGFEEPVLVEITYQGELGKRLSYVEPFILEPNTEKKVTIHAYAPQAYGNYSGTVVIRYLKP